jgi:hypothetical protein
MKYMTMKKKLYSFDLQLFADDNGGGNGEGSGDDGDDQDDDDSDEDGEEKKYYQKDVDEAVKKRLAREKRKWTRKQDTPPKDEKKDDKDSDPGDSEDTKARKEAEGKASSLEVKVACYEAGVSKDAVDDVTALARAYMAGDEDLDLEDAIEKVVKKYPQFKKGSADPDGEEEEDETKNKAWGQRQKGKGSKKTDGVEAAFLKKNPGLKID